MSNAILVINAGSSSLKFSVFRDHGGGDPVVAINGQISGIGTQPVFEAKDAQRRPLAEKSWGAGEPSDRTALLSYLLDWIEERLEGATLIAAGHRVVHGGVRHATPVLLTSAVLDELDGLVPLAPLHQPHNLAAIRALAEAHPELPQVACFDTAFHRNQPWQAQTFAIPRELTEEGVRRYGFHGLSYEYISRRLPEIAPELGDSRVVVAHLGSGASMCAIHGGRSVDSTMGFTALDGLPMGTRCGTIDPGVLIYLMRKGMDAGAIEKLLYNSPACSACRASPTTCALCWRAATRMRRRRWSCSASASPRRPARLPPRWAGWMPWCSPPASANAPPPCGRGSATSWPGWASRSTRRRMRPMRRRFPRRAAACRSLSSRPTRNG